jgi:hypothetical protein
LRVRHFELGYFVAETWIRRPNPRRCGGKGALYHSAWKFTKGRVYGFGNARYFGSVANPLFTGLRPRRGPRRQSLAHIPEHAGTGTYW